jgi:type II secretory pathway component GspD/PulD (secretin)
MNPLANVPMSEQTICALAASQSTRERRTAAGLRAPHYRFVALLAAVIFCGLGSTNPTFARFTAYQEPGGEEDTRSNAEIAAERRAQKAANRGDQADASGKLEEAWKDYREAIADAPLDKTILARGAALRSKLLRRHAEVAERYALNGQLAQATAELYQALLIDPGDTVLAQRLLEMKSMNDELPEQPREIEGLPKLKLSPGHKNFNLRGDTKSVYEQAAQQFGIKASFDPDLVSRPIKLRADDVDFKTLMSLLGTQTGTFYRPLDATLIYVAANTQEKRKQFALEAEQTFPLPQSVVPEESTELLRILREMTGANHLELDTKSHSITMRDTPERLQLAKQIIEQVERSRGEILLDVELLEVDKGTARQLGITPPFPVTATPITPMEVNALKGATTVASALTELASILSGQGVSNLTSFIPIGGGYSTLLLTLGSVAADFSDSLSLLRSGREVVMRAQDGKPATFFVGDRYPITLSLLSGSLTGGGTAANIGATGIANFSPTSFPLTQFSVGDNPSALVANTFTDGTQPDLAVVYNNPATNTFTILQNQDNGNFTTVTPAPITLSAQETGQVAIGTGVFRTGNSTTTYATQQAADVVLVNSTSNNISILLGNGNGTFVEAPGSPIAVGKNPSSVVVADFNNDGALDLAVTNKNDNSISLFEGNGDGTFTEFPGSPFKLTNTASIAETGPLAMVSGFFGNAVNQSNEKDLAIVNETSDNVTILLTSVDNNKDVTFTEAPDSPIAVGKTPVAITTSDFNGDGVADLAVVNQADDTISILLGSVNENGSFVAATGSPIAVSATAPSGIVAAPFTGGATEDLAITNNGSATLGFFVGNGDGTFTAGGLLAQGIQIGIPAGPAAMITSVLSTTNNGLPDVAFVAQQSGATNGVVGVVLDSAAFAEAASGTSGETPYPGSEYEDLGIKIKVTPTLHADHEVTLHLEFEIRALANAAVNGIPVLSNRTLDQTVRLKEDEPSILGGLTDREETRSITGLPGFAEIPGPPGYAFGLHDDTFQDTELLFVVTPRRLRTKDRKARTVYAGRGEPSGPGAQQSAAPPQGEPMRQQPGEPSPQPAPPPPPQTPPANAPTQPQPAPPLPEPPPTPPKR